MESLFGKIMLRKIDMEKLSLIDVKQPLSKVLGMITIALTVAGVGVYAFNKFQPNSQVDLGKLTVIAQSEDMTLKIVANGIVQSGQTVNLSPKSSGRVAQIFVEQGDLVKKGQKIAEMENADVRAQLLQHQASLRQAQANLAKSKNGSRPEEIAQAQARLESAQASLERSQNGNRSQEIAQAQAKVSHFRADLALTKSIAPQQAQQSHAQITVALARLQLATTKLNRVQNLHQQGAISQEKLDEANTEYQTTTASYLEAKERLQQVKNNSAQEILQRQATVTEMEQNLQQQQLGSRKEDTAKAAADMRQAKFALQQTKNGARPEEIAQLQAAVDLAQAQVLASQVQLGETSVFAPFDF
jgi:HlyD family secretion protein